MSAALPYAITAGITLAIGFGASFISGALKKNDSRRGRSVNVSSGHLITRRDHQARLPRIYGRMRVGLNIAYMTTTADQNAYLHVIGLIGEGPIKGIVREDGSTLETSGVEFDDDNPPLLYVNGEIWTKFPSASYFIEFYDGRSNQGVCTTLNGAEGDWQDALRNTAYIYMRWHYDRDLDMAPPDTLEVVVDGLEIYDPITTSTAWTDNPAIVAYNYLTASSFRGGMGVPAAKVDTTSLSGFKDYCDTKGWTANLSIHEERPNADHLQQILDGGRGRLIDSAGNLKFRFFDLNHESTVDDLTEADVLVDGEGAEQIEFSQPDIMDRPNTVRAKFINSAYNRYNVDDFVLTDDDAIQDDNDDRRELEVNVHGLSTLDKAQKMAFYHLERARYNRVLTGHFGRRCLGLEPMDLITFTFTPFGWDEKYFRVLSHATQPDMTVKMSLIEEAVSLYNDVFDPETLELFDTTLLSPSEAPPNVQNVVVEEETYPERGRSRSRIVIDFDPPPTTTAPFWDYAEVWVRRDSATNEELLSNTDFTDNTGTDPNVTFSDWSERETSGAADWDFNGGAEITITTAPTDQTHIALRQAITIDADQSYVCKYSVLGDASNDSDILVSVHEIGDPSVVYGSQTLASDGNVKSGEFVIDPAGVTSAYVRVYFASVPSIGDKLTAASVSVKKYNRWEYQTKAGENGNSSNYTIDPAVEGDLYYIKLLSVTVHGLKEDFNGAYTAQHLVTGLDSNPSNISALTAVANGSSVALSATWTGSTDVEAFEIRLGEAWNDGVTVMTAVAHSNDLRANINGVRPGTFTFWAAALNNAGNYSSTPISATVEVFIPPGYTQLATYGSWTWDFSAGTFSNAAQTTHTFGGTSYDALECSHTGDVLVGTWQSPTHDLGAVEKVKVWGDFVVDLDSADKQWASNWSTGSTWPPATGTPWNQIFTLQQSGKIRAKLLAKDTDATWTSPDAEFDFFEMQSAEIENRYVRVEIEITDPNLGSNIYVKELDMLAYEGPA